MPKLPKLPGSYAVFSRAESGYFFSASVNSDAAMNAPLCRLLPAVLTYNLLICKCNMHLCTKTPLSQEEQTNK